MSNEGALSIGIYEKALPEELLWPERMAMARNAGFDFVEMSIDESDWRLDRITWGTKKRTELRNVMLDTGIPITSMCLSALRRFPFGSSSLDIRQRSLEIMKRSIDFAVDVGIRIILVPSYDVFYEDSTVDSKKRFLEGMCQASEWASTACVMLALENTEQYLTSLQDATSYINNFGSMWFQLYADVGNLVASGHEVLEELEFGSGHIAGIHVKDTILGNYRGVPFGEGNVPFPEVFRKLHEIKFHGPLTIEMWADKDSDPQENISRARKWVYDCLQANFLSSEI